MRDVVGAAGVAKVRRDDASGMFHVRLWVDGVRKATYRTPNRVEALMEAWRLAEHGVMAPVEAMVDAIRQQAACGEYGAAREAFPSLVG
jgi:hypothetical protein